MLTVVVLAAGAIAVGASLLAGRLLEPGNGFTAGHGFAPLSLAHGPTLRAAVGSVLYLALIALLSLGAATALRDSAAAITVVLGLLYIFPVLGDVVLNPVWQHRFERWAPMNAGLAIQATRNLGHAAHRAVGRAGGAPGRRRCCGGALLRARPAVGARPLACGRAEPGRPGGLRAGDGQPAPRSVTSRPGSSTSWCAWPPASTDESRQCSWCWWARRSVRTSSAGR